MGQEGTESESVGKPWGMMKWAHLHYRKYVFKAAIIPLGFGSCFRYPVNLLFFFSSQIIIFRINLELDTL